MKQNKYENTYRGIGYHLNHKGYWVFDHAPGAHDGPHWSGYFSESDADLIYETQDPEIADPIIQAAIDKFLGEE